VLFIIYSKTFTTKETITNAKTVMKWLMSSSFDQSTITKHFSAVYSNKKYY
ncbi:MAG: glucose-6-phosphate isomerase, partial [Colwellia sp.]